MLDEPETETKEHPSSEEEEHPSGEEDGTPEPPKESFTRAEHETAINDLKREHGREVKTLTGERDEATTALATSKTKLDKVNTKLDTVQTQLEQLEEVKASGSEAGIDYIQKRKELRTAEKELQTERDALDEDVTTHAEEVRVGKQAKWEREIFAVATEFDIDVEDLEEAKPTSVEQAKSFAKIIAKKKPKSGRKSKAGETPTEEEETPEFEPDSAKTTGGKGKLTAEGVEKMPIDSVAKALDKATKD